VAGLDGEVNDLILTLTISGLATEWMAAAEAFTIALHHRVGGLALPPEPPEYVDLVFVSPAVSSAEGADADPVPPLTSAGHRFECLARWQEATLAGTDWPGLAAAIQRRDPRWPDA
jgi:hypothetical protein